MHLPRHHISGGMLGVLYRSSGAYLPTNACSCRPFVTLEARRCYATSATATHADILQACRTLGVTSHSSSNEIKDRYKKLVAQHHPDVPGGSDAMMKSINNAYEMLKSNEGQLHAMRRGKRSGEGQTFYAEAPPSEGEEFHPEDFLHAFRSVNSKNANYDRQRYYEPTEEERAAMEYMQHFARQYGRGDDGMDDVSDEFDPEAMFASGFMMTDDGPAEYYVGVDIPPMFRDQRRGGFRGHHSQNVNPHTTRKRGGHNNNNNTNSGSTPKDPRTWVESERRAFQNMYENEGRSFKFIAQKLGRSVEDVMQHYNRQCAADGKAEKSAGQGGHSHRRERDPSRASKHTHHNPHRHAGGRPYNDLHGEDDDSVAYGASAEESHPYFTPPPYEDPEEVFYADRQQRTHRSEFSKHGGGRAAMGWQRTNGHPNGKVHRRGGGSSPRFHSDVPRDW